jgi:hypothetical protein
MKNSKSQNMSSKYIRKFKFQTRDPVDQQRKIAGNLFNFFVF